jgi:hypothetical protein
LCPRTYPSICCLKSAQTDRMNRQCYGNINIPKKRRTDRLDVRWLRRLFAQTVRSIGAIQCQSLWVCPRSQWIRSISLVQCTQFGRKSLSPQSEQFASICSTQSARLRIHVQLHDINHRIIWLIEGTHWLF